MRLIRPSLTRRWPHLSLCLALGLGLSTPALQAQRAPTTTAPATAAARPTADATWPRSVSLEAPPEVTIVEEDEAKKRFVYRTAHFEFISDIRLGSNVVKEFSTLFEVSYLATCKLPLDLKPEPEPGKQFYTVQLFAKHQDYATASGSPSTIGIHKPSEDIVMITLSALGVKFVGSRVTLDYRDQDHYTLINLSTLQMLSHQYNNLPTWMRRGYASYLAWTGYDNGRFNFSQFKRNLPARLQRYGYRTNSVLLTRLETTMSLGGEAWNELNMKKNRSALSVTAALLSFYFYHLDGDKDAAHIIAFLRAVESGTSKEEATQKHLLRGRTYDQLEKDVRSALKGEGVTAEFINPSL